MRVVLLSNHSPNKEKIMATATDFVKNHAEEVGEFTATRFENGVRQETEIRHNYQPLLDWLEKFPKYVRAIDLKTGKFLIANTLYRLTF